MTISFQNFPVTIHQPFEHSILYSLNTDSEGREEGMAMYRPTARQRSCKHFSTIIGAVKIYRELTVSQQCYE
jgi:hypothetical protein